MKPAGEGGGVGGGGVGDGGSTTPEVSTYNISLGEPSLMLLKAPFVACAFSCETICSGEATLLACNSKAAAPATCGHAIEVPDILVLSELDVCEADLMDEPGA